MCSIGSYKLVFYYTILCCKKTTTKKKHLLNVDIVAGKVITFLSCIIIVLFFNTELYIGQLLLTEPSDMVVLLPLEGNANTAKHFHPRLKLSFWPTFSVTPYPCSADSEKHISPCWRLSLCLNSLVFNFTLVWLAVCEKQLFLKSFLICFLSRW